MPFLVLFLFLMNVHISFVREKRERGGERPDKGERGGGKGEKKIFLQPSILPSPTL